MRPKDRVVFRGVLLAVVLGTGVAALGASCLARDTARRADRVASGLAQERVAGEAEPPTLRWQDQAALPHAPQPADAPPAQAGQAQPPGQTGQEDEAVGTTETTAGEIAGDPNAPYGGAGNDAGAEGLLPGRPGLVDGSGMVQRLDVPQVQAETAGGPIGTADGGGVVAPAGDAGGGAAGDAGATPGAAAQETPPAYGPSFSAGAGPFATEPPWWGATAFESNPEAGAGPFTTERPWPPQERPADD
jgi:hypothetical protein